MKYIAISRGIFEFRRNFQGVGHYFAFIHPNLSALIIEFPGGSHYIISRGISIIIEEGRTFRGIWIILDFFRGYGRFLDQNIKPEKIRPPLYGY